jgi:hypothetical protein
MFRYNVSDELQNLLQYFSEQSEVSKERVLEEAIVIFELIYNELLSGNDIVILNENGGAEAKIELDIPVPGRVWKTK